MREIKFRARGKDGQWRYFTLPQLMSTGYTYDELTDWGEYIGLKDKNGKEIYFGDILQTSSDDPETDMWGPGEWGYTVCEETTDIHGVCFTNWWPTDEDDNVFNWKYVEIIGNIYENPDLLANQ